MADQAALADWENIISAHINGAPLPVMMDAVRDAAIEFCKRTKIDRRLVTGLNHVAAEPEILIPPGADGEFPGTVLTVWNSEGELTELSQTQMRGLWPKGWHRASASGALDVKGWHSPRPGVVRLVPAPMMDMPGEVDVMVAYQPPRNAAYVPAFLFELYAYEIGYGALAILHSHDRAPYADPARGAANGAAFEDAINRLADLGNSGFGQRDRRIRSDLR